MSRMSRAAGRGDGWSWVDWHRDYDVPGSPLAQRLAAVQAQIAAMLDQAPPGPLRAVSLCAGQGRDLIGVLAGHPRGADVTARLVELDPDNAATARELAAAAGLPQVEVVLADAAEPAAYAGLVPADLVLACGVFGNITDEDVRRTIQCLPQLCAAGGTVIWTRGRWAPDLIPQICDWFAELDFEPLWVSDLALPFGAGAHRFTGTPAPLAARAAAVHLHDRRGDQAGPRPAAAPVPGEPVPGELVPGELVPEQGRVHQLEVEPALPRLDHELGGGHPDAGRAALHGRPAGPDQQGGDQSGQRGREEQDGLGPGGQVRDAAPHRAGAPGQPAAEPGQPGAHFLDPGHVLVPGESGENGEPGVQHRVRGDQLPLDAVQFALLSSGQAHG